MAIVCVHVIMCIILMPRLLHILSTFKGVGNNCYLLFWYLIINGDWRISMLKRCLSYLYDSHVVVEEVELTFKMPFFGGKKSTHAFRSF
jgi:uncharacterized membrane protein YciS (DUF1049 family)